MCGWGESPPAWCRCSLQGGGAGGAGGRVCRSCHLDDIGGGQLVLGPGGHSVVSVGGRLGRGGGLLVGRDGGGLLLSWVLQCLVRVVHLGNLLGFVGVGLLLYFDLDGRLSVGDSHFLHSGSGGL